MQWSPAQEEIFSFAETMERNLVIVARAGCGKTTTIVECTHHLPKHLRTVFCAFNKSIVKELETRLPASVECATLHSIGYKLIRRSFGNVRVDENKIDGIIDELFPQHFSGYKGVSPETRKKLTTLISFAKGTLVHDREELEAASLLAGTFEGMDLEIRNRLLDLALACMKTSGDKTQVIDFDDMVWFPPYFEMPGASHDIVVVDECQDMNAAQLWIAQRLLRPETGRMIVVGDDRQAIYGWRGAAPDAIKSMTKQLDAAVLPLSTTYRCANVIVKRAREIVDDIRAAPDAPEGFEQHMSADEMRAIVRPGDFILSRANAPLLGNCLRLLAKGTPATIAGRDVGARLMALIDKSKAVTTTELDRWMSEYSQKETERLEANKKLNLKTKEKRLEDLTDTCACIDVLSQEMDLVQDVQAKLRTLFSDDNPMSKVVLSSVHKAKGLERDRVFLLSGTFKPVGFSDETDNLLYVAVTRAKTTLVHVTTNGASPATLRPRAAAGLPVWAQGADYDHGL